MIEENNVLNGFSIFENVLNDFLLNYRYNEFLASVNKIGGEESIEKVLVNKYDYEDKEIFEYTDKTYDTKYISTTNSMIDRFIEFKPVLYKFNVVSYDDDTFFLTRLLSMMKLDGIYGIILKYSNKNDFINITHPLVLLNYLYSGVNFERTFEYALLYPIDWENGIMKKEKELFNEEEYKEYKNKIIKLLYSKISSSMITEKDIDEKTDEFYYLKMVDKQLIIYKNEKNNFNKKKHKFIVPCNIICENHFIPQYIWLYLVLSEQGLYGKELISNKLICTNLSHNFGHIRKGLNYVCNGGENPYTYEGILNMLKQNVSSQYSENGYQLGFWTFVKANIDASIYILERFINE